ncbi:hypothetical protein N825_25420 [Skermanella stibiiresistens SB22]|uniref:Uncharacterized protein n=1 Tax=Skermanella stibiiresistens SB22 TaxID=1385369 RepID=W9GWF3_9PROT|nr:hypothetical protein [Skermanella stibiiresistens]EWY36777.1 hypothetical protein N825_25420 [Skermanella stibiiresistens SB22]
MDGWRHVDMPAALSVCEASGVPADVAAPLLAAVEHGLLIEIQKRRDREPE